MVETRFLTVGEGGYREARGKGQDDPGSNRVGDINKNSCLT